MEGSLSYNILRAPSLDGPWTTIATGISALQYIDSSVTPNASYLYAVQAVNYGE